MATTFLKRQKEMKRQEKQRAKAERRQQKKLAKRTEGDGSIENVNTAGIDIVDAPPVESFEPDPQN